MFFKKSKRNQKDYSMRAQSYLRRKGHIIVQNLYDGVISSHELNPDEIKEILGEHYPKAPWVDENDVVGQFMCLLKEAGWNFICDEKGKFFFEDEENYSTIVQNHLKFSGSQILDRLSECCLRTNGRITYWEMQAILGFHYPKAPYCDKSDLKACTILFLKETGIPFKFDNTYIYLP